MNMLQTEPHISETLQGLLQGTTAWEKLNAGLQELQNSYSRQKFFYLFAIAPRWFKGQTSETKIPEALDPCQVTESWHLGQVARLFLIVNLPQTASVEEYQAAINALFQTADVNEQIVLVQSLQFMPHSELFVERAREAARSNIESVFCAVAHGTSYPQRLFDNDGWDQLILKAAFLAVPIWNIVGLRERNNARLVTMLCDYVRERQAANRTVPWDLFCCPGWLAESESELQFLRGQFERGTVKIQQAIRLALQHNPNTHAQRLAEQCAAKLSIPLDNWQAIAELQE